MNDNNVESNVKTKGKFSTFVEKNRKRITGFIIFIIITVGLSLICFSRQIFGDEVGDEILGKGVENGFVAIGNFFYGKIDALIGTLISLFVSFVLYYVFFVIIKLALSKSARSRTIGSILVSLLKYFIVVSEIIAILAIWGVNVGGIFASIGIVGLIIGLGCKSIVNDIVSGFFIVIDNYFQVGDRVTIDGFTGTVVSIGLRTTKINFGADTKAICNSSISTVINTSSGPNPLKVRIDISFNEDLRRVEAIIAKNLPLIEKKIPALIEPLIYRGVTALDDCGVQIEFFTKVNLCDRWQAEKILLRELYLMLTDNGVVIPFKQVVVNGPDPINLPRANKDELALSDDLVKKINPHPKKESKKKLFDK